MEQQRGGPSGGQPSRPSNALAGGAARTRSCYGWAFDCLHVWMQPAVVPPPPAAAAADERPRCWSSPKAAALALARLLCLCAPACSYEAVLLGVHVDVAPPVPRRRGRRRRYAGGRPASVPPSYRGSVVRHGLVRRLMLEELATRQREQMEAVHVGFLRSKQMWQPPGCSRLRRMSLPDAAS